jgi:hypothetical protein
VLVRVEYPTRVVSIGSFFTVVAAVAQGEYGVEVVVGGGRGLPPLSWGCAGSVACVGVSVGGGKGEGFGCLLL